jgi:hypothetical protein
VNETNPAVLGHSNWVLMDSSIGVLGMYVQQFVVQALGSL